MCSDFFFSFDAESYVPSILLTKISAIAQDANSNAYDGPTGAEEQVKNAIPESSERKCILLPSWRL